MIVRAKTRSVSKGWEWSAQVYGGRDDEGHYQGHVKSVGGWAPDEETAKEKASQKREELQDEG